MEVIIDGLRVHCRISRCGIGTTISVTGGWSSSMHPDLYLLSADNA